jgi:hypothetical protein
MDTLCNRGQSIRGRVSAVERTPLVAVILSAAALLAFLKIAGEVTAGDTRAYDERLLLALRSAADPSHPLGPPWLEELMRDLTALGVYHPRRYGLPLYHRKTKGSLCRCHRHRHRNTSQPGSQMGLCPTPP